MPTRASALRSAALATLALMPATLTGCAWEGRSIGAVRADADTAYSDGRYADAAVYYREWLDRRPGVAEAQYRLGRSLLETGDPSRAREAMTIALDLDPDNTRYRDGLVDALVANDEVDEVYALLDRRAAEMDGPAAYLELGDVSRRIGLADDAERAYKLAASLGRPEWPDAQRALANLYRELGDEAQEVERLRVLYYLDPTDPDVRARLRILGEVLGPTAGLRPSAVSNTP